MIRLALTCALIVSSSAVPPSATAEDCPKPVGIARAHGAERAELRLVGCDGAPVLDSLDELSLLARPAQLPRPEPEAQEVFASGASAETLEEFVSPGILRLDPGLLPRLQAVADRFPGATLEIVSGYRPTARRGSRHRTGRALDIRVVGVDRRDVAEHARATLAGTGVGYYPNSTFTHIDVRDTSHHWVDLAGPGERARYVAWGDEPLPEGEPSVAVSVTVPPEGLRPEDELPAEPTAPVAPPLTASSAAEPPRPAPPVSPAQPALAAEDPLRAPTVPARVTASRPPPTAPASDEGVDWTVPWWTASRRATGG